MTQKLIKVFGERNTGTRAINQMIRNAPYVTTQLTGTRRVPEFVAMRNRIEDRFSGRWKKKYLAALEADNKTKTGNLIAWKHTAPRFDSTFSVQDAGVLFAVKNPYSWLVSLMKRPYHSVGRDCFSIEQFIDFPWMTQPRDQIAALVPSPMSLWNEKLRAYLLFETESSAPTSRLMFEDFIKKPVKTLSNCLIELGANPKGIAEIKKSTKEPDRNISDVKKSYTEEHWKLHLTRQAVVLINQYTDWEVADAFGYAALDPLDFPINLPADIALEQLLNLRGRAPKPKNI